MGATLTDPPNLLNRLLSTSLAINGARSHSHVRRLTKFPPAKSTPTINWQASVTYEHSVDLLVRATPFHPTDCGKLLISQVLLPFLSKLFKLAVGLLNPRVDSAR